MRHEYVVYQIFEQDINGAWEKTSAKPCPMDSRVSPHSLPDDVWLKFMEYESAVRRKPMKLERKIYYSNAEEIGRTSHD